MNVFVLVFSDGNPREGRNIGNMFNILQDMFNANNTVAMENIQQLESTNAPRMIFIKCEAFL